MGPRNVKRWGKIACGYLQRDFADSGQYQITLQEGTSWVNRIMTARLKQLIAFLIWAAAVNGFATCKLRVYLARAEQVDENGLRCWDNVKVPACGGRCDSSEISDWEFPFKKSYHPVCVFSTRRPLMVRLRHCDLGVASGTDQFHFIAAEDCRCKVCSSQYTSCEWLPPNSTLVDGIYDEDYQNEID